MQREYRKRAAHKLGLFALLMVLMALAIASYGLEVPAGLIVLVCVPLGIFALVYYFQTCIELAHAKGYRSIIVAAVLVGPALCLSPCLLVPPLWIVFLIGAPLTALFGLLILPLLLLFGMPDKKAHRIKPRRGSVPS